MCMCYDKTMLHETKVNERTVKMNQKCTFNISTGKNTISMNNEEQNTLQITQECQNKLELLSKKSDEVLWKEKKNIFLISS